MKNDELFQNNLWHYTNLDGLTGILKDQCLWATDYRHLNDPTELIYARKILQKELIARVEGQISDLYQRSPEARKIVDENGGIQKITALETKDTVDILWNGLLEPEKFLPKAIPTIPCIASFCLCDKNNAESQKDGVLSQWRGYGPDGGYAVVFDAEKLVQEFDLETQAFRFALGNYGDVMYEVDNLNKDHDLVEHLNRFALFAVRFYRKRAGIDSGSPADSKDVESLFHCMARFKHQGFREEKEFRFFVSAYEKKPASNKKLDEGTEQPLKEIRFRDRRGTKIPYVELFVKSGKLPIEKIVVGPHKDKTLRAESLKRYLRSIGLEDIAVICSEIPYVGNII